MTNEKRFKTIFGISLGEMLCMSREELSDWTKEDKDITSPKDIPQIRYTSGPSKNGGTTDIYYRPTCNHCKNIIWEYVDFEEDKHAAERGLPPGHGFVTPHICPHCKSVFTGIIIPTVPFDNQPSLLMMGDS